MKRKILRRALYLLVGLLVIAAAAVGGGAFVFFRGRAALQQFQARSVHHSAPNSIEATGYVEIGGATQWVSVRGADKRNPLLVWVHGDEVGPAMNGLHFFFGVGAFLSPIIIAVIG